MKKSIAVTILAGFIASQASAYELIPRTEGWNGFINVGVGGGEVKSNLLSSTFNGQVDLGNESVDNLIDGPDSKDIGTPKLAFELSYVFNDSNTQVYFGNLLEDSVRFDTVARLGIRHNVDKVGIFGVSLLSSPVAAGLKTWKDPYSTGVKRKDTDIDTSGVRILWEGVLGTNLELRASSREIELDSEESGSALLADPMLGFTPDDVALLDRNGDINSFDVRYLMGSKESHGFLLQGTFIERDLDGEAMAYDGAQLSASHLWNMGRGNRLVTNLTYGEFEHDEENPIYDVTDESERLGGSVTYFSTGAFGLKNWTFNATVAYFEEDHDIDFYDTELTMVSIGMLRTF